MQRIAMQDQPLYFKKNLRKIQVNGVEIDSAFLCVNNTTEGSTSLSMFLLYRLHRLLISLIITLWTDKAAFPKDRDRHRAGRPIPFCTVVIFKVSLIH